MLVGNCGGKSNTANKNRNNKQLHTTKFTKNINNNNNKSKTKCNRLISAAVCGSSLVAAAKCQ